MESTTGSGDGRRYTFRRYEPGDERGFLDLFEVVWDERRDEEWFRWRFEANPYLDHVAMFVAEADGAIVGVRPFLPLRMAVRDGTALGLLTVDTMVHPDHRGRGLFTTMTEQSLRYYAEREPAFVFNQPNANARPLFRGVGFRELDACTTYYRVQRPSAFVENRTGLAGVPGLSRLIDGLADGYHRLRTGRTWRTFDVDVSRYPDVATGELARLYRRTPPAGITAHRDERFYGWRFAGPAWTRRTYVASVDDVPVAGVLARSRTTGEGITLTQVADFVPLGGGADWKRGLAASLEGVLEDAVDFDVVSVPARSFPADVAASYGFHADDEPPVACATSADTALCVRLLGAEDGRAWRMNDVALCDPENWDLTFAERDTA